ncbi:MAG: hypothetical protein J5927_03150 [Oscillospiraceae bacterium]|nr:hypothetical protein [Oscillospiraceae bacterium]
MGKAYHCPLPIARGAGDMKWDFVRTHREGKGTLSAFGEINKNSGGQDVDRKLRRKSLGKAGEKLVFSPVEMGNVAYGA